MAISFELEGHISDDEAVALVEKRTSPAERARIDAHLDHCDECRELVAAMAMAGSFEESDGPEVALVDSAGLDASVDSLEDSMPTQIYAERPPAPDGPRLESGDMVAHFRIMRALGRGAMGEVYLARDTMLGRKVALKVVARDLLGSERAMRRFLFEAKATARFNHPNIVTIHAVGKHGDQPFVALEYVEGENLRERAKGEQLPLPEILRIGFAVAEALAEAHTHGILHRDLKPANVIMGADGRVRLLDFGLAKAVHALDEDEPAKTSSSSSTWLVGTPRYMAPEQWRGGAVEGSADVWSLGVILFELCSGGIRPFSARTTIDMLKLVCSPGRAPPLDSVTDVPPKLSELVAACLSKTPSDRPTAREVAAALHDLLHPARTELGVPESPFRGLLPFTERHASVFFGRDAEVASLLERLRLQALVPVLGPSGAGKSSLIQAGVIPRLREQEGWVVLTMRPGPRPFETLASRLERRDSVAEPSPLGPGESGRSRSLVEVEARAEVLRAAPRRLSVLLRELADAENAKVLLFVDQLEEVFTMVEGAEQKRFLEAVCNAADDVAEPVRVVLALRHDFVDRLGTEGELGRDLSRFVVLKPPDAEALRQMLTEPVRRAGYRFEDDRLVEQMIAAVQGEPSCLPLIQFAAAQLWARRDTQERLLLRRVYDEMGGVGGALAKHADSLLGALPSEQRRVARTLLLRLVTPERTRRLVAKRTLLDTLGPDGERVLEHLTDARLLTVSKMRTGTDQLLELAHESLIHTWRTLSEWIEHSEDELRILGEASQAAELWERRGRRQEELWGADALHDLDRHAGRAIAEIPALARRFIEASREADRKRRRNKRLGLAAAIGALALLCGVAVVTAILVGRSERDAELARQQALHHERLSRQQQARLLLEGARKAQEEGDPLEARAQVRRALELLDTAAGRALWNELDASPLLMRRRLGIVNHDVAVTADGGTIGVASHERRLYLVDARTGAFRHLGGHADAVTSLVFTNGGREVIASDLDGNVVLWDLTTNASRSLLRARSDVASVALNGGNDLLAVAGHEGLFVLELRTGKRRFVRKDARLRATVFVGSSVVAGGDDGKVRFWAQGDGGLENDVDVGASVEALAATADGRNMAVATGAGMVVLMNGAGKELARIRHPSVKALAFDKRGERLAVSGRDGVTSVLDVATRRELRRHQSEHPVLAVAFVAGTSKLALAGDEQMLLIDVDKALVPRPTSHEGVVHDARFSPGGELVASAGFDGTVRVWDAQSGRVRHVLVGHTDKVARVDFSPDGRTLASAGFDRTVRLWDPHQGVALRVLGGHEDAVVAVAFSPDGQTLASASRDRTARLWNTATGALERVFRGHEQELTDIAFAPNGQHVATSSLEDAVRIWPVRGGAATLLSGHDGGVSTVSFDHRGERVMTTGLDNVTRIWAAASGGELDALTVSTGGRIQQAAFHPDDQRIATARADGVVELRVLGTGTAATLVGHAGAVNAVHFDASGALAASAGDDGTVRVWDVASGRATWRGVALLGGPARSFTHRGWERLDGSARTAPRSAWEARVPVSAQAVQESVGGPICVLDGAMGMEVWRPSEDVRVRSLDVEIEQLLALPSGCAARTVGAVYLVSEAGEQWELAVGAAPLAIGWGEQRLLVATPHEVVAFSETGERVGEHRHDGGTVAALTQVGSQLAIGHPKRSITLLGTSPEEPPSVARFVRASPSAPRRMAAGPSSTLIAGYTDGTIALFDIIDGALLARHKLHGPVAQLLLDGDHLFVVTELGDVFTWDLRFLTRDYCELLATVWREVPVVWEQGEPTLRGAPDDHRCR